MMLGVDRLANLERQGRVTPRVWTDTRNPIQRPVRHPKWAIPSNAVGTKVQQAFAPQSMAGLMGLIGLGSSNGGVDRNVSRPDVLAAVEAAARKVGWTVHCTEFLESNPFGDVYQRQCVPEGRPDLQFSADLVFGHWAGVDAGVQAALGEQTAPPTGYTAPAGVVADPTKYGSYVPPTTHVNYTPATETPAVLVQPSTNPAPQTQPVPTTQPGVVGAGVQTGAQTQTQTTNMTGEWVPGISNTVLLLAAAAGVAGLFLLKR